MAGLRDRAAAILTDLQLEGTGTLMGDLTAAAASIGVEPAETVIDTLARLEAALTGTGAAPAAPEAPDAMDAEPAAFDVAEATKAAKKLKVVELRAALAAAGADTKGLKAALVERLVGVQRAAASAEGEATTPTPAEAEAPAPSRKRKGPPVLYSAPARQPAKLTRAAQAEISGALSPDVGGRRGAPFEADAPPAPAPAPAPAPPRDPDAYHVDVDPRPPANRVAAPAAAAPSPRAAPAPAPPPAAAPAPASRPPPLAPPPPGVRAWDPATDASAPSFGLAVPARAPVAANVSPMSPWFLCGGPPPLAKQHGPASAGRPDAADVLRRVRDEAQAAGRLGDVLRGALETRT